MERSVCRLGVDSAGQIAKGLELTEIERGIGLPEDNTSGALPAPQRTG
jgi:hypothetical protein